MDKIAQIIFVALATSAIAMTVSKSKMFSFLRDFIEARNDFLFSGISCPYCLSHWIALVYVVICRPRLFSYYSLIDWIVCWFAIVAIASMSSGLIYKSIDIMQPPDAEN